MSDFFFRIDSDFSGERIDKTLSDLCSDFTRSHIQHIIDVGGIDCCAIGSDFDGMGRYPVDLRTSRDFPTLADALLESGLSESEVEKVMFQNLYGYMLQFV